MFKSSMVQVFVLYLEEGAQGKGCGQPVALVGQALCLCAGEDGVTQPQSSDVHLFRAGNSPNYSSATQHTGYDDQNTAKCKECTPLLVASELPSVAGTRQAAMQPQACQWSHWQMPHAVSAGSAGGVQWRHPAPNQLSCKDIAAADLKRASEGH